MSVETPEHRLDQLIKRFAELAVIAREHQAAIVALVIYLREQPGYDEARLRVLFDGQRQRLNLPKEASEAVLLDLLRAFEGPIK